MAVVEKIYYLNNFRSNNNKASIEVVKESGMLNAVEYCHMHIYQEITYRLAL